ncbi:MAG: hypothetical protein KJ880_05220 [Candidatus Omnitrophica bacterium]|nr:hypothetical protein [Candidatus Omnitrophota bacterium]MBU1870480.1 hypothetical protein [Candidatus Omnitrophota bacterium]
MNKKLTNFIIIPVVFVLCVLFVAKFSGPSILKLYITTGIGDCKSIPILCRWPQVKIEEMAVDRKLISDYIPYTFPKMKVQLPKKFDVVQERIKRIYFKRKHQHQKATIYLLHQNPGFFIGLFPQVTSRQVKDDFEFLNRTMNADINDIKDIADAFFVIMKSIFIPNLGDQDKVVMAQFQIEKKRGFLNYNLSEKVNLFDCNIFDEKGNFYKIYIKDLGARLDLQKVYAIISTVEVSP